MKNLLKMATAAAFVAVPLQVTAQTADVPFEATVTHTCVINVGATPGTLVASADFGTLSSTIAGGQSGTASITATGNGFDISIDTPSAFDDQPPEDTTDETFNASFSTNGASNVSGTAADGQNSGGADLNNGTTTVDVDLVATKTGADIFEAGAYEATVVLRCE